MNRKQSRQAQKRINARLDTLTVRVYAAYEARNGDAIRERSKPVTRPMPPQANPSDYVAPTIKPSFESWHSHGIEGSMSERVSLFPRKRIRFSGLHAIPNLRSGRRHIFSNPRRNNLGLLYALSRTKPLTGRVRRTLNGKLITYLAPRVLAPKPVERIYPIPADALQFVRGRLDKLEREYPNCAWTVDYTRTIREVTYYYVSGHVRKAGTVM